MYKHIPVYTYKNLEKIVKEFFFNRLAQCPIYQAFNTIHYIDHVHLQEDPSHQELIKAWEDALIINTHTYFLLVSLVQCIYFAFFSLMFYLNSKNSIYFCMLLNTASINTSCFSPALLISPLKIRFLYYLSNFPKPIFAFHVLLLIKKLFTNIQISVVCFFICINMERNRSFLLSSQRKANNKYLLKKKKIPRNMHYCLVWTIMIRKKLIKI